jgi:hypothetical protein
MAPRSPARSSDIISATLFSRLTKILTTIGSTPVYQLDGGAIQYTGKAAIDADGSPYAYNPSDTGIDYLTNARPGGAWTGVVTDSDGEPVLQGPKDPAPGYYVSQNTLVDTNYPKTSQRRYADPGIVPFIVASKSLIAYGVKRGDFCLVEYNGSACRCIVGDFGGSSHIGEVSIACAEALGFNSSPKSGGVDSGVTYTIFPGSGIGWPLDVASIESNVDNLTGGQSLARNDSTPTDFGYVPPSDSASSGPFALVDEILTTLLSNWGIA